MRIKKKNVVGTARIYIPQKKAMQKLQLPLKDFRRLCILKGVYPREPVHSKKANKGSTQNRIYYHLKDIQYLASEPIINKFREYKVFLKKLSKAKNKQDMTKVRTLFKHKPVFRLDHLVFISIKGIYYQAEIMGEKVTWVVGHEHSVGKFEQTDMGVMSNFVDFYVTMLSFVNFRLYKTLGFYYPPQLRKTGQDFVNNVDPDDIFQNGNDIEGKIESLAVPLERNRDEEPEVQMDSFDDDQQENGNLAEKLKQAQALHTLFAKCKFFLNREVPKEPLAFVIRSCGGTVSWENCPAHLYSESSSLITHQIVDRNITDFNLNRIYIQPQWVFDCFNNRRLLPTQKYSPGSMLPPHLSPFVEETVGEYVPPERIEELKASGKEVDHLVPQEPVKVNTTKKKKTLKEKKAENKENDSQKEKPKMKVQIGRTFTPNKQMEIDEKGHHLKLREMMIPKKHRRVYKKIKFGQKRKTKEINALKNKRAKLTESSVAK